MHTDPTLAMILSNALTAFSVDLATDGKLSFLYETGDGIQSPVESNYVALRYSNPNAMWLGIYTLDPFATQKHIPAAVLGRKLANKDEVL